MGAQPVRRRENGVEGEVSRETPRIPFDPNLLEILDALPSLALLVDGGGRVLWLNLEAARLWNAVGEPAGLVITSLLTGASARRAAEQIGLVMGGLSGSAHREWRVKEGTETRVFDVNASLMLTEAGPVVRFLAADITRSKRAEQSVAKLSERLLRLQDEERRRLARDLHDSTGQNLAALGMKLGQVERSAARLDSDAQIALRQGIEMAAACSREIRTLSYLLHPPLLDELGLIAALKWFTEGFSARSKIGVALECDPEFGRLPIEVEITIFRVVQEALTNVHRHSGSQMARVALGRAGDEILLEIEDWGVGGGDQPDAEPRQPRLGVGVLGMRERIQQFGGDLEVRFHSGGTTVLARIPSVTPSEAEE